MGVLGPKSCDICVARVPGHTLRVQKTVGNVQALGANQIAAFSRKAHG